jgi:hypothetical protein
MASNTNIPHKNMAPTILRIFKPPFSRENQETRFFVWRFSATDRRRCGRRKVTRSWKGGNPPFHA